MEQNNLDKDPVNRNDSRPQETDAKELIRKHIEDPTHEITDEDIRNVKIDVSDTASTSPLGAEALARLEEREDADIDEDEHKTNESVSDEEIDEKPITPWDLRDE